MLAFSDYNKNRQCRGNVFADKVMKLVNYPTTVVGLASKDDASRIFTVVYVPFAGRYYHIHFLLKSIVLSSECLSISLCKGSMPARDGS